MRLIDADIFASVLDFVDADVCEEFPDGYYEFGISREKIRELLRDFPAIDAVPVVRCRDCKQGEIDNPDFPNQYYCHAGCGWNKGSFYCAYGERKEGAD